MTTENPTLQSEKLEPCPFCGGEMTMTSGRSAALGAREFYNPSCERCNYVFEDGYYNIEDAIKAANSRASVVAPQVYADGYCARCSELSYPLTRALEATGVPTGADNWQQTYGPNKVRALADFESELRRLLLALEEGKPEDIKSRMEWANHRIEFHAAVRRRLTALAQEGEPEPAPAPSPVSSPVPPEQFPPRVWVKLLSNGELAAYRTDIRPTHFDGRPVSEYIPAATPTPVVAHEQDAFADLLPLTAVRIAPGEYEIKSRDGRTLWRMEGAALADWVCASVSGYDAALRTAGVSPSPSEAARKAAEEIVRDKGIWHLFNPASDPTMAHDRLIEKVTAIISRYSPVVVAEGDEPRLKITPEVAAKLIHLRDTLAKMESSELVNEAWHTLYSIADPEIESFFPWAELEKLSSDAV